MKKSLYLGLAVAVTLSVFSSSANASALSGADFRPGRIIDDAIFYNKDAMTVAQIQAFLNRLVPTCDTNGTKPIAAGSTMTRAQAFGRPGYSWISHAPPYTCVRDYFENPTTKENNLRGRPVPAGARSAAQIIYDASQAHGINPQVLIVMMQKESLGPILVDDWPLESQYRTVMGYGCPDGAPCNSEFFGFSNQVNKAAWQFRRYTNFPNQYNYTVGPGNFIYYRDLNPRVEGSMLRSKTKLQPIFTITRPMYQTKQR